MRYYRDPHVEVTSGAVRIDGASYPVRDLLRVWHQRGRGTARTRSRVLGRLVLVLIISALPLGAVVCGVSLFYSAWDRASWGLAAVIVAACVIGAIALAPLAELPLGWLDRSYDRGDAVHELWARLPEGDVLLLRTSDGLRFGQIYRAVQRAVDEEEA
jgi:uncharacterized protein DUF6232